MLSRRHTAKHSALVLHVLPLRPEHLVLGGEVVLVCSSHIEVEEEVHVHHAVLHVGPAHTEIICVSDVDLQVQRSVHAGGLKKGSGNDTDEEEVELSG